MATVLNEITPNIQDIVDRLLPHQIQQALELVGQLVENESKERCGVDTGILRGSIKHDVQERKVVIGSNVEYAPYHHEKNRFLQQAMDENMDSIENIFRRELLQDGD